MKQSFGQKGAGGRFLALVLALIMLCSVMPMSAYAAAVDEQGQNEPVPAGVTYIFHVGETEYHKVKVLSGEALTKPEDPAAEEGKVFTGWRLAGGQEFTSFGTAVSTSQDETVSLYAHFADAQPANEAPAEEPPAQEPAAEPKTEETKTEEPKTEEGVTGDENPAEDTENPTPVEPTPAEPVPAEPVPTEPQPAEGEPAEAEPAEGEQQTVYTTDAQTADELYVRLMAAESLEEMDSLLDNLTEEQYALMDEFSEEQYAALEAKMADFGAYEISTLATPNELTIAQGTSGSFTVAHNINGITSQSGSYADAADITVSSSGSTFTVTASKKVLPGEYEYTVTYTYKNGRQDSTATETVKIIVTGDSTEVGVYYQMNPNADADDNSTAVWGDVLPTAAYVVNTDGVTWADGYYTDTNGDKVTIPDKNIFNPGQYVLSMPTGLILQEDGSYELSKETYGTRWSQIFETYKGQLIKKYPTLTNITEDDVEGIYLTPYKISKNNGMNSDNPWPVHIDCTVSLKVRGLISARFIVTTPDQYDNVVEYRDYVYKTGPLIEKTTQAPLTPDYPETMVGEDGKTYRFDGWYNEAKERVTMWDTDPNALYTPNEAEMANGVVEFRARYVPVEATLTINKVVNGNIADYSKTFTFTYDYNGLEETNPSFELAHNGSYELTVPYGTEITITETGTGDFTTSWELEPTNDDGSSTIETSQENPRSCKVIVSGNATLTCTNTMQITPDTGILLDSLPYVLILGVVAAGAVLTLVRRRRHDVD